MSTRSMIQVPILQPNDVHEPMHTYLLLDPNSESRVTNDMIGICPAQQSEGKATSFPTPPPNLSPYADRLTSRFRSLRSVMMPFN